MMEILEKFYTKDAENFDITHDIHRTKIVATVGPACDKYEQLLELVKSGVNVFRLNFSHGNHEDKLKIINHIRKINRQKPYYISILADLQGPKLRLGDLENGHINIVPGDELVFTSREKVIGTKEKIYVSYPDLHNDVKVGEKILIDDGKIEVQVKKIDNKTGEVTVTVNFGGTLLPKKGVNLPDTDISLPAMTKKDLADLEFIIEQQLDWVALSFVRKAQDIIDLKQKVRAKKSKIKVMAKIEMPSALNYLDEIIAESDAIMVARGDLGVELPVEKVPNAQRTIIRKCLVASRPVIVATQMMESMIDRTRPNRSEITDVANAVLEGADAVMLSGETAMGKHPALVVQTMRKIILEIENTEYIYDREESNEPSVISDAICYSTCKMATDINAAAIIGMTQSGYTGFCLSSFRPRQPLYVFTKTPSLVTQLGLGWGIRAFFYDEEEGLDEILEDQMAILKKGKLIKKGDIVVNTGSTPVSKHLPTNMVKVSVVE